jgi:hypothetical protein
VFYCRYYESKIREGEMEHVERIRGIRVYAIIMEILNENITWKS